MKYILLSTILFCMVGCGIGSMTIAKTQLDEAESYCKDNCMEVFYLEIYDNSVYIYCRDRNVPANRIRK